MAGKGGFFSGGAVMNFLFYFRRAVFLFFRPLRYGERGRWGGSVVRPRARLGMTSGDKTQRLVYVQVVKTDGQQCTHVNSIVITMVGRTMPGAPLRESRIVQTMVMHAYGRLGHSGNVVVQCSSGTTIIVSRRKGPGKAQVFNTVPQRLERLGFAGVISLTPRMLWKGTIV